MKTGGAFGMLVGVAAALGAAVPACGALSPAAEAHLRSLPTPVAVFNFQMKTDTPEWKWLEKGLSDRIATDFVQDPKVSVLARDEMQVQAEKMHWVPELAMANSVELGILALKITYLVTGVYSVTGDRIAITAQVVELKTRREVARKETAGPVQEVLDLQRRLSAELLAWFTKKPAAQVLETLPVWTRSLPAAKALYEGMDLYDQGRYAEAWLKFRQARREDREYVEAQYWVGKMYYFLDRYEHARLAMERFMYLDAAHPRLGDAIVEYLHTYESLDTPPDTLLPVYAELGRRYPDARVFVVTAQAMPRNQDWLRGKAARLCAQTGRYEEAIVLDGQVAGRLPAGDPMEALIGGAPTASADVGRQYLTAYHAATGRGVGPDVMGEALVGRTNWLYDAGHVIYFREGTEGPVVLPSKVENDPAKGWQARRHLLVAPPGHTFKTLRLCPVTKAKAGVVRLNLRQRFSLASVVELGTRDLPAASAAEGARFDRLPHTGVLEFVCLSTDKPAFQEAQWVLPIECVRVEATFEKPAGPGAIEVDCGMTPDFYAEVDGLAERRGPGLIGPLAAGTYTVRLRPAEPGVPFGQWSTPVTVEPGRTARVTAGLPWGTESDWSSWTTGTLVGRDYPGYRTSPQPSFGAPCLQVDNECIRVAWSFEGDLWWSASTDGRTYARPRKLPLPVSSAWREDTPKFMRDESGRFVLRLSSDRDPHHGGLTYVTWSRDFRHWSAPAKVADGQASLEMQNDRGWFLGIRRLYRGGGPGLRYREAAEPEVRIPWSRDPRRGADEDPGADGFVSKEVYDVQAGAAPARTGADPQQRIRIGIVASRDAYRWFNLAAIPAPSYRNPGHILERVQHPDGRVETRLSEAPFFPPCHDATMHQSENGRYELFANFWLRQSCDIWRYCSNDGAHWEEPERVISLPAGWLSYDLFASRIGGRTYLTLVKSDLEANRYSLMMIREDGQGGWQRSREVPLFGAGRTAVSLAYHPRWGFVLAWMRAEGPAGTIEGGNLKAGPYVIVGRSVEPFFARSAHEVPERRGR